MTQEIPFPKPMPKLFEQLLSENRNSDVNHLTKIVDEYFAFANENTTFSRKNKNYSHENMICSSGKMEFRMAT